MPDHNRTPKSYIFKVGTALVVTALAPATSLLADTKKPHEKLAALRSAAASGALKLFDRGRADGEVKPTNADTVYMAGFDNDGDRTSDDDGELKDSNEKSEFFRGAMREANAGLTDESVTVGSSSDTVFEQGFEKDKPQSP